MMKNIQSKLSDKQKNKLKILESRLSKFRIRMYQLGTSHKETENLLLKSLQLKNTNKIVNSEKIIDLLKKMLLKTKDIDALLQNLIQKVENEIAEYQMTVPKDSDSSIIVPQKIVQQPKILDVKLEEVQKKQPVFLKEDLLNFTMRQTHRRKQFLRSIFQNRQREYRRRRGRGQIQRYTIVRIPELYIDF